MLTAPQFIEDLPPARFCDHLDGGCSWHPSSMPRALYICQGI
jgi:hypothetical protein